ncbi:MAG: MATE family efflux transporter [Deltaproteobacteria bacterium]|nr:MATE family efflux transporter [Deltaproteobacteria bacterium]
MPPKMGLKSDMLGKEKVGLLLFKMSAPAIIGMMVQYLYNIVDGIFIGHYVGPIGLGAIHIVMPMQMILMALGMLFGIGGASIISRRMGNNDQEGASLSLGNMIALCLGSGFLCVLFGVLAGDLMIRLSGANEALMPYCRSYFYIIILGTPMFTFSMAGSSSARAEGNANVAMISMLIGAILNILLDALFIVYLGFGIKGAASATVLSMSASAVYLILFYVSGKSVLSIHLRHMILKRAVVWEMASIGMSDFARTLAMSLTMALMNNTITRLGEEISMAAFAVFFRVSGFLFMAMMGIGQGAQPIIGFNYGANQLDRVKKTLRLAILWATIISLFGFAILEIFPGPLIRIFSSDPELIRIGKNACRLMVIAFPLIGYQMIAVSLCQALGKAGAALFLALSRQVVFLIPMILILPRIFGITGVWLALPAADAVTFVVTFCLVTLIMRNLTPSAKKPITE